MNEMDIQWPASLCELSRRIIIITDEISQCTTKHQTCDNVHILEKKQKAVQKLLSDLPDIAAESIHLTGTAKRERAQKIGYTIKSDLLQDDLNDMNRLHELQIQLQEVEELFLFSKQKELRKLQIKIDAFITLENLPIGALAIMDNKIQYDEILVIRDKVEKLQSTK